MQVLRILALSLLLSLAAVAAELKVKVLDPDSTAVAGARVALYAADASGPIAVRLTSGEGVALFRSLPPGEHRIEVLAPGFASAAMNVKPGQDSATVQLKIAGQQETVVVSATRTLVPSEASAADTTLVTRQSLENLQPAEAADVLRFLPGAVVNQSGRRGALSSLFVRGGESRYNKVIVDDVTINDPGGTFDFGVIPLTQVDRIEFVRGAESNLYGSDAMTSVIQFWSRNGSTHAPELFFGAEGGTFATARGYASLSGARGCLDYNLFGEQFNTQGQGVNDDYSNSGQGANVGVTITPRSFFRFRTRHSNSRTGVQSFWNFNGQPLVPPDTDQRARQNNFLASGEFTINAPSRWQHRFVVFEYNHRRFNVDSFMDPGRVTPAFGGFSIDTPFQTALHLNRAGVEYQGEYWERSWAHLTFGYRFEDENGFVGDPTQPPVSHGLRRNHDVYAEQVVNWKRLSVVAGARFVHNENFGNKGVPRIAASVLALRGGAVFSGTRLRFAYGTGIKEPRLEETFATGSFIIPNPNLKPEENRSFEAGLQQSFFGDKWQLSGTYFNNLFRNQIDFSTDPVTFISQYVNLNEAMAHGSELVLHGHPMSRLSLDAAYTYVSGQVLLAPQAFDPLLAAGQPLLRRPKHSGNMLITYSGHRWGSSLGGTFVGRRPDSDFFGLVPHVDHAAGYGRLDLGGWYALTSRVTAYANLENALNRHYEESAGYPALRLNFRAGFRFRIGGD